MRILYISKTLSIHDYRFLEKFSSSDHEVLLFAPENSSIPEPISSLAGVRFMNFSHPRPRSDYKYYLSWQSIIIALRHIFYRVIERLGLRDKIFNHRTILSHSPFLVFFYRQKLSKAIHKFKPDIIHAGWVQLDGLIAALTGFKPILQMPWGSDILIAPFLSEQLLEQTKYVISQASCIYCDCEEVKKTILKIADFEADKIEVFPMLGINLKLFNPQRTDSGIIDRIGWKDKRIIIMTRTFNPIYGVDYFIMALPKIIESEPDTRVLLVGKGKLEDNLKKMVDSLDLTQYVRFTGEIPNEDLVYYLNCAEIYVSTSKSDGTSLSLLEAMACGLPVVVSDVPANCEWVKDGENGYIVPRKKVPPISEKVITLLNNPSQAQRMGEINLGIARERADWNINFSLLENIYREMTETNDE